MVASIMHLQRTFGITSSRRLHRRVLVSAGEKPSSWRALLLGAPPRG
jgi:hypothetical protein